MNARRTTGLERVSQAPRRERGAVFFLTFLMMLVLVGMATGVAIFSQNSLLTGKTYQADKQAFYVAEAGWQRARQALSVGTWSPGLCTSGSPCTETFPGSGTAIGQYQVSIAHNGDNTYTVTSSGYTPNATTYAAKRQLTENTVSISPSGTNLSLAATASSSSNNGSSHAASKANDGDSSSYWEAGTKGPNEWLKMDLGSNQTVSVIWLYEKNNNIDDLTVEYSTNDSTWTTVPSLSKVESPSKTWLIAFTATSARYFRATFTSVDSSKQASVKEYELYGASTYGSGPLTTQW